MKTLLDHYRDLRADLSLPACRCLYWAKDRLLADRFDREIDYDLDLEPEWESPEDCHCDPEAAQYVREQMESGNEFAWFCAKITVRYMGEESEQYLGGCSYRDFDDFKYGGYFTDMIQEGLDECQTVALSCQCGEH